MAVWPTIQLQTPQQICLLLHLVWVAPRAWVRSYVTPNLISKNSICLLRIKMVHMHGDIIFNKLVLYKEPKFLASLSILSVFPHLQLLQDHPCSWGHREGYSLSSFPYEWSSSRQWHSRWHYPHTRPTF